MFVSSYYAINDFQLFLKQASTMVTVLIEAARILKIFLKYIMLNEDMTISCQSSEL